MCEYCGWCYGFDGPPPGHGRSAVAPTVGLVFGAARSDQSIGGLRVVTSVDAARGLVVFRPAGTDRAMLPDVGAYFDGSVLADPDVYRSAAASFGLDADVVAAGFAGRDVEALRRDGVAVTVLHGRHVTTPALIPAAPGPLGAAAGSGIRGWPARTTGRTRPWC